jgi:hypothetical protein
MTSNSDPPAVLSIGTLLQCVEHLRKNSKVERHQLSAKWKRLDSRASTLATSKLMPRWHTSSRKMDGILFSLKKHAANWPSGRLNNSTKHVSSVQSCSQAMAGCNVPHTMTFPRVDFAYLKDCSFDARDPVDIYSIFSFLCWLHGFGLVD